MYILRYTYITIYCTYYICYTLHYILIVLHICVHVAFNLIFSKPEQTVQKFATSNTNSTECYNELKLTTDS